MTKTENFEKLEISSSDELWQWLEKHHRQESSIWLVTWKAADRARYVSRETVLDALVAYGWIDGIRRKLNDHQTMQLISLRKQQIWAETYKTRAAKLIAENRMQPSGLASIETAKSAGLWDALAEVDNLDVPPDLRDALGTSAPWFEQSAPSYRRNVLRWIATAKKPETRAKRVATVADCAKVQQKVPNY